jgi:thiamine monophosphate synthase
VSALNTEEGWLQDVSLLIARKVRAVAYREQQELTEATRAFIDAHTELADQQVLPLW